MGVILEKPKKLFEENESNSGGLKIKEKATGAMKRDISELLGNANIITPSKLTYVLENSDDELEELKMIEKGNGPNDNCPIVITSYVKKR